MADVALLDNITALLANPDVNGRVMLREVLNTFLYKAEISQSNNIKETETKIDLNKNLDAVLISSSYSIPNISSLVKKFRNQRGDKAPGFIVTMKSQSSSFATQVSELYMCGVAGFICEPFSSYELLTLLATIRTKRLEADKKEKQRRIMAFLFQEAVGKVNELWEQKAFGASGGLDSLRQLKNINTNLKGFYDKDPEAYAQIIADVFEQVSPPEEQPNRKRIKKSVVLIRHPSAVAREIMEQRKLTMISLKHLVRIDITELELFLQEKRGVDDAMSRELARLFGRTAREWMRLQRVFDEG